MDIYCPFRKGLPSRGFAMFARFEKRAYVGSTTVWVGKYRNLHNILHWHMEHEIIACREGHARVMVDDSCYTIGSKQCIFCSSGSIHSIDADEDCTLLVCLFNEKMNAAITSGHSLLRPAFDDNYALFDRLSKIRWELYEKQAFYESKTEAMIRELLVDIFRGEPVGEPDKAVSTVMNKYKHLLGLLDSEYEFISFSDAARFMNFSEAYFSRYFKKLSGMTFSQYLNVVKIEKAVEMLTSNPAIKTTDVMMHCGFNTIRSFNRAFKEITGYTPKTLPAGYVLNTRSVATIQSTFDPTLDSTVLLPD